MGNTWPNGRRHAMTQSEHENWNAGNWPGTRQLCTVCEQPTGCCEEDEIVNELGQPICEECSNANVTGLAPEGD